MTIRTLYIWVEGDDDERFFARILAPLFQKMHEYVRFVKYASLTPEKIEKFINSIESMENTDYIFVADKDKHPCVTSKKDWITNKYRNVDRSKILVVTKMIESWYVSGLTDQDCRRMRLKLSFYTDEISKEDFEKIMPAKYKS